MARLDALMTSPIVTLGGPFEPMTKREQLENVLQCMHPNDPVLDRIREALERQLSLCQRMARPLRVTRAASNQGRFATSP